MAARPRARDLGIVIGRLPPGPHNGITDVAGIRVGHTTLIQGNGRLVVGKGPVRTGVTLVMPHDSDPWREALYAGSHRLNGNGELTGLEWIRESGLLSSPIALTNTHSVGVVRDAIIAAEIRDRGATSSTYWALPVVGETYDGQLNDINGLHVRPEHLFAALADARAGAVAEGNVGGGTGMICHEFKGGIGTASRVLGESAGGFTVGVLVQANYGWRHRLSIDGVPVGREIPVTEVPSAWGEPKDTGSGSIIGIVATDAPLLPHQCERLAQRAALGVGRVGGAGENSSGDLFLAFATGNGPMPAPDGEGSQPLTRDVRALGDAHITPLFWAVIEATEEAILNALLAADTMVGRDGNTAHALPHDRLLEVMARYRP
ncbi:MAG: P1 family peptidase [Chloroflexi bacterium]|nr:P1 family peptidase [Chloroflexota bacterium]